MIVHLCSVTNSLDSGKKLLDFRCILKNLFSLSKSSLHKGNLVPAALLDGQLLIYMEIKVAEQYYFLP